MFPEAFQEFFVGKEERGKEQDKNERSEAKSDIGMKTKAEDSSGDEEVSKAPRAQPSKKEVKRERQEKGRHDGAEADA